MCSVFPAKFKHQGTVAVIVIITIIILPNQPIADNISLTSRMISTTCVFLEGAIAKLSKIIFIINSMMCLVAGWSDNSVCDLSSNV